MTNSDHTKNLETLLADIRHCRLCRDNPNGSALPHEPRPVIRAASTARILIAGQAPGTRVHKSGKPFTDPSGDRLREWMGVGEDVFYDETRIAIVPMGFCFPGLDDKGGDLPPRRECPDLWREKVVAALDRIELVLVVGQYAQRWHLGKARAKTLTETVRNWKTYVNGSTPVTLPLPHPSWRNNAWIKRNPWFERELLPVLRERVAELIG